MGESGFSSGHASRYWTRPPDTRPLRLRARGAPRMAWREVRNVGRKRFPGGRTYAADTFQFRPPRCAVPSHLLPAPPGFHFLLPIEVLLVNPFISFDESACNTRCSALVGEGEEEMPPIREGIIAIG
ncbi:hypothetical protein GUJ93_ZPchr0001g29687 [Zizania palustris]|uniref:Uncharacterized protein n=1 Tax=Zizania palustris TaxID=103762 RepID=A0A8J5RIW0_ZIZPA|nr:hypothetical protein GUJ93_ZPchr0001g29687 [Zizania palustris]